MIHIIDCKGLQCPNPVINTKKYFDSISEGESLIIVDNELAKENISKFASNNGFECSVDMIEGIYNITVKKQADSCQTTEFNSKKLTVVISSDMLGNGDSKLGIILMKSYLYALSENDVLPTDLIFLNSGVKLITEGSDCMESLNKMKDCGVNILICGTCLDFYNLKEKILIGEISNMYAIVEKMNNSQMTIKL